MTHAQPVSWVLRARLFSTLDRLTSEANSYAFKPFADRRHYKATCKLNSLIGAMELVNCLPKSKKWGVG